MEEASVWTPGRRLVPLVNANSTLVPQAFYGNEGQKIFNITNFEYVPDVGSLLIFINGVLQLYGTDYLETNSKRFTLFEGVEQDDLVVAYGFVGITGDTGGGGGSTAGVNTFNTRNGDVVLTAADVNTALGYIPGTLISFNTRIGAISLTYADVITALGFVPDSGASGVATFNTRNGAVTLTSLDVTTALGFTPAQVAGTDTQIQFNDGGVFAGSSKFTLNKTTGSVINTLATGNSSLTLKTQSATPTDTTLALGIVVAAANTVAESDNFKNSSVQTYMPSYYSRRTVITGASSADAGSGPYTQHFGLLHDVSVLENCSDAAAVMHNFKAAGTDASYRAETAAYSYYHEINTLGTAYSSVLEGRQKVVASGTANAGGPTTLVGLQCSLDVDNAAAANVASYFAINTNNISPTFRANSWAVLGGKWNYILEAGASLDIDTCGIDLYSRITWPSNTAAVRLSKKTFLDFRGEDPGQYYMRADAASNTISMVVASTGIVQASATTWNSFVNVQLAASKTLRLIGGGSVPNKTFSVDNFGNLLVANNAGSSIMSLADSGALSALNFGLASVSYSSSIVAETGTFTSASITSAYYMLCGKLCFFDIKYAITTVGTAADGLVLGLPFVSAPSTGIVCTTGHAPGGILIQGGIKVPPDSKITVGKYDGTTVCNITGTGRVSGFFEHNQL